ncbi:MAG: xylulose 5-phosphate 3-epimerase, partial [Mesoaciditoga sp.]
GYLTAELSPYRTHPEMLAYDASKKLDILNRM